MYKWVGSILFCLSTLCLINKVYSQQDVDFHLNAHLLPGKNIIKVKRDYYDPYLWVLAQNNEVYRVNSLTLAVDDYTAAFSAYNNLQFIDIAGRSQDTVFIATNSSNIIEDKKDILTLVGIGDNVTSIGMANDNGFFLPQVLLIGTLHGLGKYDVINGTLSYFQYNQYKYGPIETFATTYRSTMVTDNNYDSGTPNYYPVLFTTFLEGYSYDLRHTDLSGSQINTAFYVPVGVVNSSVYDGSFFWGNDNGLYQESLNFEGEAPNAFAQYLTGIKVNKLADIFGLTSFYGAFNPAISKDNLLIGTNNGLYFSNSLMNNFPNGIASFSIFHCDILGNLQINDLCVNSTATNILNVATGCENGVWVAAADGLYLLNPDYAKYLDPATKAYALSVNQTLTDSVTTISMCVGDTLKTQLNSHFVNDNTIQWKKNGKDIIGENKAMLSIVDSGEYYAILYSPCENVHIETNRLKVVLISSPVFSFNYPDKIQQCNNNPDTLKTDNNPAYHYRWYTNGALNGDTTYTYVVNQTGKYKVEVSACTNTWVPSKEVEVDQVILPQPQITADKSVYCAGDVAMLTVNTPVDSNYTINWYCNGSLIANAANAITINDTIAANYTVILQSNLASCSQISAPYQLTFTPAPVFTSNFPNEVRVCNSLPLNVTLNPNYTYRYRWYANGILNGDTTASFLATQTGLYKVEASSCAGSWVSSNVVQADIVNLPIPVIGTDKPAYCTGDNATLTAQIPSDPFYNISWYRNNVLLLNYNNQNSIVTDVAGNYAVSVVSNQVNSDGTICSQTSVAQTIAFNPPPTVSIKEIVKTTLCEGQKIILLANYTGGSIKWSTGETTDQISITVAGTYQLTVTSPSGCQRDTSINVTFLPDPVLKVSDTSICVYKNQAVTLTAPPGFARYEWNGQTGNQTYQVSNPQTVTLTVTDVNGCQDTQQIKVIDQCSDIYVPNAFTPNNDGINDTWVIEGLYSDQTALVSVFNRYGTQIYQSRGYGTPWNGEYRGKKLSPGVYYYIITARNGTQKFSGSLTILY